ncbi:MAG: hypothetical protein WAT71_01730 [Ignavibacteria bacterium]
MNNLIFSKSKSLQERDQMQLTLDFDSTQITKYSVISLVSNDSKQLNLFDCIVKKTSKPIEINLHKSEVNLYQEQENVEILELQNEMDKYNLSELFETSDPDNTMNEEIYSAIHFEELSDSDDHHLFWEKRDFIKNFRNNIH